MIPDSDYRTELQLAGFGERVTLPGFADVHDIFSEISYQFPQLLECGGFDCLKERESIWMLLHHQKMGILLSLEPITEEVSLCNKHH